MKRGDTVRVHLLFVLCILAFTSCKQSPERVVEKYMDYTFLDNNGKKAYRLLCEEDKFYKTEKEFVSELKKKNILNEKVIKKYDKNFNYKILGSRVSGDTTYVKVEIIKPNAEDILNEMVNYTMFSAFTKINDEERNKSAIKKFNELLLNTSIEPVKEIKEFPVIKENRKYKIFLNLGLPVKMEEIKKKVQNLKLTAAKKEKVIQFDQALETYKKINSMSPSEEAKKKITELEYMRKNTLSLGEMKQFGNIEFSPERIEVRRVQMMRMNWYQGMPINDISDEEYFVLTFKVTNKSKNQIFSYEDENKYVTENTVRDNIGNTMNEFGPSYDIYSIENNSYKKLSPGETKTVKVVCEAPVSDAEYFVWEFKMFTDNDKNEERAFVAFKRAEVLENLKMAQK